MYTPGTSGILASVWGPAWWLVMMMVRGFWEKARIIRLVLFDRNMTIYRFLAGMHARDAASSGIVRMI